MLLCPAPATTMSKRSSSDACCPMEKGATASGASAAVFTNPRRLILLMCAPPSNNLLRFLVHDFLDARPKIFQHYRRRVSSGPAGHRAARMRRRASLIKAGNRHSMLRVSRHWAHRSGLRRSRSARVTTAVPVVRIHALQIKRTLDDSRENLVVRQIAREPPQKFQIRVRNLVLDFVPMLRALFQFVRVVGNDLERVHARGRTRRISDAATNCMDRRVFKIHLASSIVITHAQN